MSALAAEPRRRLRRAHARASGSVGTHVDNIARPRRDRDATATRPRRDRDATAGDDGDLDTDFSADGKLTADFGGADGANVVSAAGPAGKYVVAGTNDSGI